jgi:hypothetical protein
VLKPGCKKAISEPGDIAPGKVKKNLETEDGNDNLPRKFVPVKADAPKVLPPQFQLNADFLPSGTSSLPPIMLPVDKVGLGRSKYYFRRFLEQFRNVRLYAIGANLWFQCN